MPRWGKSVSRRRHARVGLGCTCGCGEAISTEDLAAGRSYMKIGHRPQLQICCCGCGQSLNDEDLANGRSVQKIGHRRGETHPSYLGKHASVSACRRRAVTAYPATPCSICGSEKSERHHVDGNVNNNARSNIQFLCRKHHMQVDGRTANGKIAKMVWRG